MDARAARDTYLLLQRFSMPHEDSTIDAVSLRRFHGLIITSLYTLMIAEIIKRFWRLLVVVGVTYSMRKEHSPNRAVVTVGVWNAQASPSDVAAMTASYIFHIKKEIWYPLLWTVLALLMAAAASSVSIVLPPLLNIGTVAPVNPSAIFIPEVRRGNETFTALSYALQASSALRAVGAADTIRSDAGVVVEEVPAPGQTTSGNRGVRIDYRYAVTGSDFGFQHAPDLVFDVKGSCVTEPSWRVQNSTIMDDTSDTVQSWTDTYLPWNDESELTNVSSLDNGPPFAIFVANPDIKVEGLGNSTFAIIPSSLWRFSFTAGEDPWYRTIDSIDEYPRGAPYSFLVRPNRPALSCWETAIWSYHNSRVDNLHLKDLQGLDLPAVFEDIVKLFLANPMITRLGTGLGRSSLASSIASVGSTFYADRSTIHNDLTRLVNASYVATRNMMVDTTRFNDPGSTGIRNLALVNNTNTPRPGVGDFVVSSPDIMTLSVRSLITVPVVLAAIFLLTRVIALVPAPWRSTDALDARVLYSYVHQMAVRNSQAGWQRLSSAPYNKQPGKAPMNPGYDTNKGVFWTGIDRRDEAGTESGTYSVERPIEKDGMGA